MLPRKRIAYPIIDKYREYIKLHSELISVKQQIRKKKNSSLVAKEAKLAKRVKQFKKPTWKVNVLDITIRRFESFFERKTREEAIALLFGNAVMYNGNTVSIETLFEGVTDFFYDDHEEDKERLVWLDRFDYVCGLFVRPYVRENLYLERSIPVSFFRDQDDDDWEDWADSYYERVHAPRLIQKAVSPWIDKPVTNDGKSGVNVRLLEAHVAKAKSVV